MKIGSVIRKHRKILGLTLEALAIQSNTDAGNLSRIERGLQSYTPEGLEAIANALGTTASTLMAEAEQTVPIAGSDWIGATKDEAEQELLRSFRRMSGAGRIALRQVAADMARAYSA